MSLERRERDLALSRFLTSNETNSSSSSKKQVVEIIKNRFLLACVHDEAAFAGSKLARESLTYSIDRELVRRLETVFDSFFRPRLFSFFCISSLGLSTQPTSFSLSLSLPSRLFTFQTPT